MAVAELLVENGRMTGTRYVLDEGRSVTIGRSAQSDLHIPDQGVSRLHCRIDNKNQQILVTDLGSSNGTRIGEETITTRAIADGERIVCGTTSIRVRLRSASLTSSRRRSLGHTSIHLVDEPPDTNVAVRKTFLPGDEVFPGRADGGSDAAALDTVQKRLHAVFALGAHIHAESDLSAILDHVAETILAITRAHRSAILLRDGTDGTATPVATRSTLPQDTQTEFRISTTIVREAMQEGVSIITGDAGNDERFQAGMSIVMENIQSVMCVPLRARDSIIGAIYVDSTSLATLFDEEDLALLAAIGNQTGVAVERARLVRDLEHLFVGAMHAMVASLEAKDAYTRGHSERVTAYALLIAEAMGVEETDRRIVELAGLLHDVGKIGVPEAVLCKPGSLTDEEFDLIREHPPLGAKILEKMPELERLVDMQAIVRGVRHHHERFDGGGYPDRLAGSAIPLCSRILAAADTFDAIAGDRVYRKGRGAEAAMRIIREVAGTQLDPEVVAALEHVYASGALAHPERVRGRFQIHQSGMRPTEISGMHEAETPERLDGAKGAGTDARPEADTNPDVDLFDTPAAADGTDNAPTT